MPFGWAIARLAQGALDDVAADGHLPTHAAMHPATAAALHLCSRFEWSELLPGASGACRCSEDPNHRSDVITLYRC
jgi:hypothetical protein